MMTLKIHLKGQGVVEYGGALLVAAVMLSFIFGASFDSYAQGFQNIVLNTYELIQGYILLG